MNITKVLGNCRICLLICVSFLIGCGARGDRNDVKIDYIGRNLESVSNIGIGEYKISFHNNDDNKVYSFGYYNKRKEPDGAVALFYDNGNLNSIYHTIGGKRDGSSIYCNKEGDALSLDNFKNDMKHGLQYKKNDNGTYVISIYEMGELISIDTIQ